MQKGDYLYKTMVTATIQRGSVKSYYVAVSHNFALWERGDAACKKESMPVRLLIKRYISYVNSRSWYHSVQSYLKMEECNVCKSECPRL